MNEKQNVAGNAQGAYRDDTTGITRRKRFIQLCVRSTTHRRALGAAPAEPGKDWTVLVRKVGAAGK